MQKQITQGAHRRAENLSKVLYEYVASLMNSGEIVPELPDLGFQVTKVEIHPDLSHIKVYWEASGTSHDVVIEDLLVKAPTLLRRTLIGLRVMGSVPNIHFMKDLEKARIQAVEHLLALADMGPDHIPTKLGEDMKEQAKIQASSDLQKQFADLSSKFRQKELFGPSSVSDVSVPLSLQNQSDDISDSGGDGEDALEAEMQAIDNNLRSDVYGINHSLLTQKLAATKTKAKSSVQDAVQMPASSILNSLPYAVTENLYQKPKVKQVKIGRIKKEAENELIREVQLERYERWKSTDQNQTQNDYENELESQIDEDFYSDFDDNRK